MLNAENHEIIFFCEVKRRKNHCETTHLVRTQKRAEYILLFFN
jgi:uncharacterized protein YegP (UPF0339 family)